MKAHSHSHFHLAPEPVILPSRLLERDTFFKFIENKTIVIQWIGLLLKILQSNVKKKLTRKCFLNKIVRKDEMHYWVFNQGLQLFFIEYGQGIELEVKK